MCEHSIYWLRVQYLVGDSGKWDEKHSTGHSMGYPRVAETLNRHWTDRTAVEAGRCGDGHSPGSLARAAPPLRCHWPRWRTSGLSVRQVRRTGLRAPALSRVCTPAATEERRTLTYADCLWVCRSSRTNRWTQLSIEWCLPQRTYRPRTGSRRSGTHCTTPKSAIAITLSLEAIWCVICGEKFC